MAAKELDVWLYGTRVGVLREARTDRITLTYSEEAARRWPNGRPVLSISLPMTPDRRHPPAAVGTWLDGLLPEGEARDRIEQAHELRRGDLFGLLEVVGGDCAGAVVIQAGGGPPPPEPGPPAAVALDDRELAMAISELGDRPLGTGGEVRVSLAGQQPKLVLARTIDGRWGRPANGSPSTHILKPQDQRLSESAHNEAACVNAATALGLGTASAEVVPIAGRDVLVVSRYDRDVRSDGTVARLHQEDFCQAISLRPTKKHWTEGNVGHRLAHVARHLDAGAVDGLAALVRLLQVAAFHVGIGNADAHAKNHSLLLLPDGHLELAPIYDAMSTIQYPLQDGPNGPRPVSRTLALPVGGATTVDDVTLADLIREGRSWGLSERVAGDAARSLLHDLPDALAASAAALGWTTDASAWATSSVRERVAALLDGRPAGDDDRTLGVYERSKRALDAAAGAAPS